MNVLERLLEQSLGEKNKNVALAGLGMGALLTGQKLPALALFGKGFAGLERHWRAAHPEFAGNLEDRWEEAIRFYEATHQEKVNRKLHIVGIPMIVGGAAGLLLFSPFRPLWFVAASSFTAGWVLNFIGHGVFEKNAPAFADDPLSFLAGPVWDFRQLFRKEGERTSTPPTVETTPFRVTGPAATIRN
ncbi:MAG: DUF962 domain-containing protein [Myxococcales bacterium]|nr:DUF962 domain-containing protein [Myxococcales bacterium]